MFAKRSQGQLNASHWPRFGLALIALPLACLAIWVPGVASADLVNVAPSAGSTPAAPAQQTSIPSAPAPAPTPAAVATATPQAAPTTPAAAPAKPSTPSVPPTIKSVTSPATSAVKSVTDSPPPTPAAPAVHSITAPVEHAVAKTTQQAVSTVDQVAAPAKPTVQSVKAKVVETVKHVTGTVPSRHLPTAPPQAPVHIPAPASVPAHPFVATRTPGPRARSHGSGARGVTRRLNVPAAFTAPALPGAPRSFDARKNSSDAPATRSSTRPAGQDTPPAGLGAAPAGAASSGFGPSLSFAVLMSMLTLAAIWFSRLRIAPAVWRSVAVVSLIERPG